MFLTVVELVVYTLVVAFVSTQIISPLWHGTQLLPMFRKRHELEQKVAEAKEKLDEVKIENTVEEIKNQIEKEKKK